ncbi:MAG: glutamine-hydrolyzing carbamoyl-phosphate synthase small subunit [Sphaerochaetaceae bacterium]|nr:glutamine-hydrolyzing carbamoyl-phosphate synthase small subunit [Sphaerochaetaceae bacterium]
MQYAHLVLADGTCFKGIGVGSFAPTIDQLLQMHIGQAPCGEVVFNTTMGAYHEILTDPSYAGQMVTMTSAHIGNYGCDPSWDEMRLPIPACRALIARDIYLGQVPPNRIPIDRMLKTWHMCAISEVDTRAITLHIRDHGASYGVLVRSDQLDRNEITLITDWLSTCPPMEERDLISEVIVPQIIIEKSTGTPVARYALIDFGVKRSIVKELLARHIEVVVIPSSVPFDDIICEDRHFDAVFLSNGPGDPAILSDSIKRIRNLNGVLPIVGICLGHQLIAHALGAKTRKMSFGHHGGNQPVVDHFSNKVFVTAQNHGYCVDEHSLSKSTEVWFTNANDGTIEGIIDQRSCMASVQFHPEASPGPLDGRQIFDKFIEFITTHARQESTSCR